MSQSKVIKGSGYSWQGVQQKQYKTDTQNFKEIHRYSLLGENEPELNVHTRYFEVQPGGYSSLEQHRHPHSVVIIRGSGSVVLGNTVQEIAVPDVVYVAPETIHQFHADRDEPLGFICVVDRYRDKPVIPDDDAIRRQIQSDEVLRKIQK
ncbi:MAG: cupin domain-containing protein [Balneolaceae bacterium]